MRHVVADIFIVFKGIWYSGLAELWNSYIQFLILYSFIKADESWRELCLLVLLSVSPLIRITCTILRVTNRKEVNSGVIETLEKSRHLVSES